jgi:hypothetical protein
MTQDWRGPINGLLYGLIFAPEITDELVAGCADAAINYTVLGDGPEVYYEAIHDALASGERLDGLGQLPQFDQAQVADFCVLLRLSSTRYARGLSRNSAASTQPHGRHSRTQCRSQGSTPRCWGCGISYGAYSNLLEIRSPDATS